ncbi:MAG TPA: hypothetical protein VFW96_13710 [Thermomicrobiales bacterium]|nr:hypothetical protein [Thermomicrobiales bacterium]
MNATPTAAAGPYLGIGLYSIADAARIIGVTPTTLRAWLVSSVSAVHGEANARRPAVTRHSDDADGVLSFVELVELLVVKNFRQAGVKMPVIREVAERASARFGTPHPFTSRHFAADGAAVFDALATCADQKADRDDMLRGRRAFEQTVRPFSAQFDYAEDGRAARFWPRQHDGRVVLDPRRAFGQPIDAETGVPTAVLYDAVSANPEDDAETIARWFAVPVAAVDAAVAYERSLRAG